MSVSADESTDEPKIDRTELEDFGVGGGRKSRTVFEANTVMTGRVRVVDYRNERRLICSGDILSIYPGKNGGFSHSLAMARKAQSAGKSCAIGSNCWDSFFATSAM